MLRQTSFRAIYLHFIVNIQINYSYPIYPRVDLLAGLLGILTFYGRFNIVPDKTPGSTRLKSIDSFQTPKPKDLPQNYKILVVVFS